MKAVPQGRALVFGLLQMSCTLVMLSGCHGTSSAPTSEPDTKRVEVELKDAKIAQVSEAIQAHKGKVVVVDVWATFCIPCMREFPNLVELQQKYCKDGLVCVSVSLDQPERQAKALEFLTRQKAKFQNFRLDEPEDAWQSHYKVNGPPVIQVYGRDGKLAKQFVTDVDKPFSYEDVKKLVQELLSRGS